MANLKPIISQVDENTDISNMFKANVSRPQSFSTSLTTPQISPMTPTIGFGGAGTGLSAGALVGGPVGAVVGGAIGLGTDIIGMVMQYQAQEEQKRENQRIERINERRYRSDKAEEDRRYKSNKAMAKEEQAYQRGQTELNREERQEQLRYTRAWDFTNRMASLVNRNTNYRDRFRGMRA